MTASRTRAHVGARHTQLADGEMVRLEYDGTLIACGDCGLAHLVKPRVKEGGIWIRMYRKGGLTRAQRKALGVEIVKAKGRRG